MRHRNCSQYHDTTFEIDDGRKCPSPWPTTATGERIRRQDSLLWSQRERDPESMHCQWNGKASRQDQVGFQGSGQAVSQRPSPRHLVTHPRRGRAQILVSKATRSDRDSRLGVVGCLRTVQTQSYRLPGICATPRRKRSHPGGHILRRPMRLEQTH